ncbi:MAG: hypothetical protein MMC33_005352 [Icmadophila ericetorum]|nr:hypothetical protein [Icmadophila ericetorum]
MAAPASVCIPVVLDAFILNAAVADDSDAKIAPITQPNYTFLRLDHQNIQNDILDHVDLHYTSPREHNSRVTDLGTGNPLSKRFGAYISWTLPRAYRSGTAATTTNAANQTRKQQQGYPASTPTPDYSAPEFRPVPTRWLVVRLIDTGTVTPQLPESIAKTIRCRAWVVESDLQSIWDNLDDTVDLQVDVSPFVAPSRENALSNVAQQAEVFIGHRFDIGAWSENEKTKNDPTVRIKPLSLLNSSNHLFADFQHHNSNVFSMLDDFSYTDGNNVKQVMELATASYYVIGWHADPTEDPFYMPSALASLQQRVNDLKMSVDGSTGNVSDDITNWLGTMEATTTLSHGAIYDVSWARDSAPIVRPAKNTAISLTANGPNVPVAIGTTPTDALVTYVAAHKDAEKPGLVKDLEGDLWAIRTLLLAQDDGADPQLKATDMLYNYGYQRTDGGIEWHRSGSTDKDGTQPLAGQTGPLIELQTKQSALDNMARAINFLRWQLFSVWWRYVSGADGDPASQTNQANIRNQQVTPLLNRLKILLGSLTEPNSFLWLQNEVVKLSQQLPVEKGASPNFCLQKDPTLMVGGIDPGWPADFLDDLSIRLDFQLLQAAPSTDTRWGPYDTPNNTDGLVQTILAKLPISIQKAAASLLREFPLLHAGDVGQPTAGTFAPLYHDHGAPDIVAAAATASATNPNSPLPPLPWRDRWNGQPWFPLFVEWEAEYFHIPFEDWGLDERKMPGPTGVHYWFRYGINDGVQLQDKVSDTRTASGRILLLPQPSFSLQSAIEQLLHNLSAEELNGYGMTPTELTNLKNYIYLLPYLSHTLGGLTDHLVTRVQGTHIKPTQRPPGEKLTAMDAAVSASSVIGVGADQILLQDTETHVTPYGRSIQTLSTQSASQHPAFKPVTHGQLRFTQLNIIDKFGQAISAIDPTPALSPPRIAPALADQYVCQESSPGVPNVVQGNLKPPFCEFVQLPPSINQPTRLNAVMTMKDVNGWRATYDWDSPIWGWVVVNYVENAIQLFLPDGTFYREVRHGGTPGGHVTPAWSPFPKPSMPTNPAQLDFLIAKLIDHTYLEAFFNMINEALGLIPAAPNSYAQYLNSIVGKPLALVNMGWSLELATPPLQNESVLNLLPQDRLLLPASTPQLPSGQDPKNPAPPLSTPQYSFPLKLGDSERTYDGLIGFWKSSTSPSQPSGFDLDNLFTYWDSPSLPNSPTKLIQKSNFPCLSAFHVSPDAFASNGTDTVNLSPTDYQNVWNQNLSIFSAIIDPFTAIHGYSGILPIQSLSLPSWTVESAMNKMLAFFHTGPLIITQDVPPYVPNNTVPQNNAIAIPAVGAAQWEWLQPYDVPAGSTTAIDDNPVTPAGTEVPPPTYMGLGLAKVDTVPRFENAPYVAIEGILQLVEPIMKQPVTN